MSFLIGVLIFVVALLVSVMLHEAGHFVTAKAFGMKATQFFVGFGSTIWSTRRGETEYGVKALPVGGFVKITGMTTIDDVDPADEPRSFRAKPGWQRSIVLAAGSFMHFLIAFVLLWILAVGVGVADQSGTTVSVLPCVPARAHALCAHGDPRSPAVLAGLRSGDKIVAVAGQPVHNWTQIGDAIKSHPAGTPVPFTISRGGRQITKQVSLASISWHKGAFLGVSPVVVYNRAGPISGVSYAGSQFGSIASQSVTALGRIPKAIPYLFSKDRANTPGGQVSSMIGAANITGDVVAASIGWQQKLSVVLLIIIEVNIFVGIFNLVPLLPLDGGHLAVVLYERARAGVARLLRRPDPGPVDIKRLIPVSVGVFAVIVAFGLLLIAADIINPLSLTQ
ncbi:MAG TPA: site-2 protease family protein [Streptosporangiaceae bacterium]|nr:site-2 protease family protein [Streptosporangiaceae bacterium]